MFLCLVEQSQYNIHYPDHPTITIICFSLSQTEVIGKLRKKNQVYQLFKTEQAGKI